MLLLLGPMKTKWSGVELTKRKKKSIRRKGTILLFMNNVKSLLIMLCGCFLWLSFFSLLPQEKAVHEPEVSPRQTLLTKMTEYFTLCL